jgi:hypothetical protein
MSYAGFTRCQRLYKKVFWENSHNRCATFSCLYYWTHPELINDFIKTTSDNRYDDTFNVVRAGSISGTNMTKEDYMKSNVKNKLYYNFPYSFSPSVICRYCNEMVQDPDKMYDW